MKFAIGLVLLVAAHVMGSESAASENSDTATTATGYTDTLIVTGRLDDLESGKNDGGGTIDWLRSTSSGNTLNLGLASFSVGDSRWSFAKIGGVYRPQAGVIVHGEINYGFGERGRSSFPYEIYKAGLIYESIAKRLYLKLEDQYIDIDQTRGHLIKGGTHLQVLPELSVELSYAESVTGNLNSRFILGRMDYYALRARLFGGFALGRSTPEIFDGVIRRRAETRDTQEFFIGIAVPLSRYEITLALSHLKFESSSKTPLTLSIKIPL